MVLRELLDRMKEKRSRFKAMQDEDSMQTKLIQRKKNANERELERYLESERQKSILEQLKYFREKEKAENRKMSIVGGKNVFKGHKSVLTNNPKLFGMEVNRPKNIFFMEGSKNT